MIELRGIERLLAHESIGDQLLGSLHIPLRVGELQPDAAGRVATVL